MLKTPILVLLLLMAASVHAQSSFTSIRYNKLMQPALKLELPYTTEDVEATILERLERTGYKPVKEGHLFWKTTKTDGFYVFNNVILPSLSSQKLDMYFKVTQLNKVEKNNSVVYLLVSTGNENFASPQGDTTLWNSALIFLNGFTESTVAYGVEQDITKQEDVLAASVKKLATLRDNQKDMEGKLKKLQDDLLSNQNNQKDQQADIENQEKSLEALKLKRKP